MSLYSEQILFAGEANVKTHTLSRLCRIFITTKRMFFLPIPKWLSLKNAPIQFCNINAIAEIQSTKKRLILQLQNETVAITGDNIKGIESKLLKQKRILSIDQIPQSIDREKCALLFFAQMTVDNEETPLLLTHHTLAFGGKKPALIEIELLDELRREGQSLALKINQLSRRVEGENVELLSSLLHALQTKRHPVSPPQKGTLNDVTATFTICQRGILIESKGFNWLPFDLMISITAKNEHNLSALFANNQKHQQYTFSLPKIKPLLVKKYLDLKAIESDAAWSNAAVYFDSDKTLHSGILEYHEKMLTWIPSDGTNGWHFEGSLCHKDNSEDDTLRILSPIGPLAFDISSGREGQAVLWRLIEDDADTKPKSPIAEFINLRATVRLKVGQIIDIRFQRKDNENGQVKNDNYTSCELIDLSFGGCALGLNMTSNLMNIMVEECLLEILIPIQEKKIHAQGIISHMAEVNTDSHSHRFGIQFVNLDPSVKREIFNESLRLARSQLMTMEAIADNTKTNEKE